MGNIKLDDRRKKISAGALLWVFFIIVKIIEFLINEFYILDFKVFDRAKVILDHFKLTKELGVLDRLVSSTSNIVAVVAWVLFAIVAVCLLIALLLKIRSSLLTGFFALLAVTEGIAFLTVVARLVVSFTFEELLHAISSLMIVLVYVCLTYFSVAAIKGKLLSMENFWNSLFGAVSVICVLVNLLDVIYHGNQLEGVLVVAFALMINGWMKDPYSSYPDGYMEPLAHVAFSALTFGVYPIVWCFRTAKYTAKLSTDNKKDYTTQFILCLFVPFYMVIRLDAIAKEKNMQVKNILGKYIAIFAVGATVTLIVCGVSGALLATGIINADMVKITDTFNANITKSLEEALDALKMMKGGAGKNIVSGISGLVLGCFVPAVTALAGTTFVQSVLNQVILDAEADAKSAEKRALDNVAADVK